MLSHPINEHEFKEVGYFIRIYFKFDRVLFYMARKGLCLMPSNPWQACHAYGTDVCYFNSETGESVLGPACYNIYLEKV